MSTSILSPTVPVFTKVQIVRVLATKDYQKHIKLKNLPLKTAGGLIWPCGVRGVVVSATKRLATGRTPWRLSPACIQHMYLVMRFHETHCTVVLIWSSLAYNNISKDIHITFSDLFLSPKVYNNNKLSGRKETVRLLHRSVWGKI